MSLHKPRRFSIDRRFQLIILAVYVLVFPLALWAMFSQWSNYSQAEIALRDLGTFQIALDAMLDLSEERAATAVALADDGRSETDSLPKLRSARAALDEKLSALLTVVQRGQCGACDQMTTGIHDAQSLLERSRARIDVAIREALPDRDATEINEAIGGLLDTSDQIAFVASIGESGRAGVDPWHGCRVSITPRFD